jgi:hypothetical protein
MHYHLLTSMPTDRLVSAFDDKRTSYKTVGTEAKEERKKRHRFSAEQPSNLAARGDAPVV